MDIRTLALFSILLGSLCLSEGKPVSLVYRCPCRYFESNVPKSNIKHLKILSTSNCSLQIVARLKHNGKQICLDPKTKWIQDRSAATTPGMKCVKTSTPWAPTYLSLGIQ
uniref:Stromal cell-derived factor 1 n=1 Tax=Xenopus tropicalis TaxID=8364 RepID=F7B668_XENTR